MMIANGRQFNLTLMLPDERSRGIGVVTLKDGEVKFFGCSGYVSDRCIAKMKSVVLLEITTDGMLLSGYEPGGSSPTYQQWWLMYTEGSK